MDGFITMKTGLEVKQEQAFHPESFGELVVGLDIDLPDTFTVGGGAWLYLKGWCFHPVHPIVKLEVVIDGEAHPVSAHSIIRPDVQERYSLGAPNGCSLYSGFWVMLLLTERQAETTAEIILRATLRTGFKLEQQLASINLRHKMPTVSLEYNNTTGEPLIAICMATYNPPPHLFRKQIESIVNQTHTNWVCVISDDNSRPDLVAEVRDTIKGDPRFLLSVSPGRQGFYYNFERCLYLAPRQAEFIALADQDDFWHPDKLQSLISHFDAATTLVYSDMKIVDEHGEVLSNTYWTNRLNNHTNLASLLICNTITGAASLFKRELLNCVLPFPQKAGLLFHDHWIACVAMLQGKLGYVDRPLYEYTQHSSNVIGHSAPPRVSLPRVIYYTFNNLRTRAGRLVAREVYFDHVVKLGAMARTAEVRCGRQITKSQLRLLRKIAKLDQSWSSCLWLALRGLLGWRRRSVTIGSEYHLLLGAAWKFYITFMSRLRRWRG